jgi:hypothetical protein
VNWDVIARTRVDVNRLFYIEKPETLEIYALEKEILLRCVKDRKTINDLWIVRNLSNAVKINKLTTPNEEDWQKAFLMLLEMVSDIRTQIKEVRDVTVRGA